MNISPAREEQLEAAFSVIVRSRDALDARGILQWDPAYPDRLFLQQSIADGSLFILADEEGIQGVVVLNETQLPEWSTAAWQDRDGRALVIHALAITPECQGRGYGRALMRFSEALARARGYTSTRLDAFSGNENTVRFYERDGYILRGEVRLVQKRPGHQQYYCFEKSLVQG